MEALPHQKAPLELTWDLHQLYEHLSAWEDDVQQLERLLSSGVPLAPSALDHPQQLLNLFVQWKQSWSLMLRVRKYAKLWYDEDQANPTAQTVWKRAQAIEARTAKAWAFLAPLILTLPEARLRAWIEEQDDLKPYAALLEHLLQQQTHSCSSDVEALLARLQEVARAPREIARLIAFAPAPTYNPQGKASPATYFRWGSDRELRRQTFASWSTEIKSQQRAWAEAWHAHLKMQKILAETRGYPSIQAMRLDEGGIPEKVYEQIMSVIASSRAIHHRSMRLCKQSQHLDALHLYDLIMPPSPFGDAPIPFEEARQMVLHALHLLGPTYRRGLERALHERWIDVLPRPHKASGGYAVSISGSHPFVLMNYTGALQNVYTLAHELGHAMHFLFSLQHQPLQYHPGLMSSLTPPLVLIEVPSEVNGALFLRSLLQQAQDRETRRKVLEWLLAVYEVKFFGSIFNTCFEQTLYHAIEQGESMTAQTLTHSYKKVLQQHFGPDMVIDEDGEYGWVGTPHLYFAPPLTAFQYVAGVVAAESLVNKLFSEGETALSAYYAYLQAGTSRNSVDMLKEIGIDLANPLSVEHVFARITAYMDELEAVL